MKAKIPITIVVSLLMLLTVAQAIPVVNKVAEWSQHAGGKNAKAPPEIGMVTFVNVPYWDSPPWYPPEEETETYRLVMGGLQWASDDLPVDCVVYTSEAPEGAFAAVTPAFDTWDAATTTDIYGSISENDVDPPPMDANSVSWGIIDGLGGAVAVTQFMFWANTKELIKFSIILDSEEPWSTTGAPGAFDIQNVVTHELGHTLVLDDLRSPRDGALTMHAYTWLGDIEKRGLGLGDIFGIQAIYGE